MTSENLEQKTNKFAKALSYIAFPVTGWVDAIKDGLRGLTVLAPCPGLESAVKKFFSTATKSLLGAAGVITGFPLYVFNHELMHSVAAKIRGSKVAEISINDYIGGKLFSQLPGITTLQGGLGNTDIMGVKGSLAQACYLYAPQLLAIPGIYLLYKGIAKKNPFLTGFGAAFAYGGFEMAFNHKWGSDFGQILTALGSDSKALFYTGAVATVGATYYLSKKIAEQMVKFDNYLDKKIPKLKFKAPLLVGALTAGLFLAGKPNVPQPNYGPGPTKYHRIK